MDRGHAGNGSAPEITRTDGLAGATMANMIDPEATLIACLIDINRRSRTATRR